ncbi:MAG: DUF445 family protein [Pseudomonadota bacterium]
MIELGPVELAKLAELKRVKLTATLVLFACFLVMVGAMWLEHQYPALAFIAAFAEAATIGGIADWYAVVALFKRPLNLPIPHTAIIPNNQERIGDNLGRFIEKNFLAPEPVSQKLKEVDFADEIAKWLSDERKARGLAHFLRSIIPQLLESVDQKGLVKFAANSVTKQLKQVDLSPIVNEVLDSLTRDDRHQKLMDEVILALHRFLNDEEALKVIQSKVKEELPTVLNLFRADALVVNRIIKAAASLLDEIKDNPEHELREEFEQFLKDYAKRLKRSKRFAARIDTFKKQILARPELMSIAQQMWTSIRTFIEQDVQSKDSILVENLAEMFIDVGKNLKAEKELKQDINDGMILLLSNFVASQKTNISMFISEQVKSWDFRQLITLIEANIGKDLQYIRFNGMIIGGFVGLALYIVQITIT